MALLPVLDLSAPYQYCSPLHQSAPRRMCFALRCLPDPFRINSAPHLPPRSRSHFPFPVPFLCFPVSKYFPLCFPLPPLMLPLHSPPSVSSLPIRFPPLLPSAPLFSPETAAHLRISASPSQEAPQPRMLSSHRGSAFCDRVPAPPRSSPQSSSENR